MARLRAILAAGAFCATPALAETTNEAPYFASLTLENDLFVGFDRHYTNGVQAAMLVNRPSWVTWSNDPRMVLAVG